MSKQTKVLAKSKKKSAQLPTYSLEWANARAEEMKAAGLPPCPIAEEIIISATVPPATGKSRPFKI